MEKEVLLDKAFKEAAKKAKAVKSSEKREKHIKADLSRLDISSSIITSYLNSLIKAYKEIRKLDRFSKELLKTDVDYEKVKLEYRGVKASLRIIKRLTVNYRMRIKYSDDRRESNKLRKEFYGRLASVVKRLKYEELERFIKGRRKLPHIRKDVDTIIIAGAPNVGKSLILKQLSGSRVQVNEYPFTTKKILIGYMRKGYEDIQLIDTPGLLDRAMEKRNKIEKKAILALKFLSKDVVFVIDYSESCGYSVEQQLKLLDEIKKLFKARVLLVATHRDLKHKKVKVDIEINAKDKKDIEKLKKQILLYFYGWDRN